MKWPHRIQSKGFINNLNNGKHFQAKLKEHNLVQNVDFEIFDETQYIVGCNQRMLTFLGGRPFDLMVFPD